MTDNFLKRSNTLTTNGGTKSSFRVDANHATQRNNAHTRPHMGMFNSADPTIALTYNEDENIGNRPNGGSRSSSTQSHVTDLPAPTFPHPAMLHALATKVPARYPIRSLLLSDDQVRTAIANIRAAGMPQMSTYPTSGVLPTLQHHGLHGNLQHETGQSGLFLNHGACHQNASVTTAANHLNNHNTVLSMPGETVECVQTAVNNPQGQATDYVNPKDTLYGPGNRMRSRREGSSPVKRKRKLPSFRPSLFLNKTTTETNCAAPTVASTMVYATIEHHDSPVQRCDSRDSPAPSTAPRRKRVRTKPPASSDGEDSAEN